MTFSESITTCFKKYVDFNRRASSSEFWYFNLFLTIIGIIPILIWLIQKGQDDENRFGATLLNN